MIVDISGLNKIDVLLALYDHAHFSGSGYATQPLLRILALMSEPGHREQAKTLIGAGTTDFKDVDLGAGSKPLKVNLTGDNFDAFAYDRDHGFHGYAAILIRTLRTNQNNDNSSEESIDDEHGRSFSP